jgi:hypothetical protein
MQRTVNVAFGLVVLYCCCSAVDLPLSCCRSAAVLLLCCCRTAVVLLCFSNDHGQSSPVICRKITRRQIRRFQE